ncbi:hypothetical protein GCM10010231_63620 [Streptomyces sindenensis]|nr:hypothetical protein GCM10010231_63620 [Streptomyces sindenensis]
MVAAGPRCSSRSRIACSRRRTVRPSCEVTSSWWHRYADGARPRRPPDAPGATGLPTRVPLLALRPLTPEAVAEFVALPTAPPAGDDVEALDAELARRGWSWEHELACESFRTRHGHVLCSDDQNPFGQQPPLTCAPELPSVADEKALEAWITAHVDR